MIGQGRVGGIHDNALHLPADAEPHRVHQRGVRVAGGAGAVAGVCVCGGADSSLMSERE